MKKLLFAVSALFFVIVFTFAVFGASSDKALNLFEIKETEDFAPFSFKQLAQTSALGWSGGDGETLKRTTHKGIGGYVLTSETKGGRADLLTSLSFSLDIYGYKKLYFVVRPNGDADCNFEIQLTASEEKLVYAGTLRAEVWSVVALDVGFISGRNSVTEIGLSISGGAESVSFSGPYVRDADKLSDNILMSDEFSAVGTELEYEGRGTKNETLSFRLSSQRITVTGKPSVARENFDCGAIRIVMTNSSEYESMEFRYTYFDVQTGKYQSSVSTVALVPDSAHFSYLVDTEKAGLISSFSLIFDETGEGKITVEKIEPVYVYPKKSDASCGTVSLCRLDSSKTKVTVSGSVNHNFLIMHDNYTLALYALRVGETFDGAVSDGAKPIVTGQMSSQFRFEVKTTKLGGSAVTRRFVVAAVSPDGEPITITSPTFAEANFGLPATSSGRTNIKGIESELAMRETDIGLGYAVVDLYLDRLVNGKNSGTLCAAGDEYICFDLSYLDELDMQIKNLYASGSEVLLRLMVSKDADPEVIPYADASGKNPKSELLAISVSDKRAETHFSATVDFIAKRYSSAKNGKVTGFILGKALDMRDRYFASSAADDFSYAKQTAETAEIMAHSAAGVISGVKIFLPISEHRYENAGSLDSELLLTSICRVFDASGGLPFSLILEGTSVPYGLPGTKDELVPHDEESDVYCTDNIYVFERLLNYLSKLSASAPRSFIYCWTPDISALGYGLSTAYVYNYYSIMFSDHAGAFILSTDGGEEAQKALGELNYLMRYIDTDRNYGGELCKSALGTFGADSWSDIINGYDNELIVHRTYYETEPLDALPPEVKGRFTAWDFSDAFGVLDWFRGASCRSVALGSAAGTGKSLRATMERSTDRLYSYADLVYKYEYPEDARHISHIAFDLTVGEAEDGVLYEIMVLLRGEGSELASKKTVLGGDKAYLVIDIGKFESFTSIDSVRICVRVLSGKTENDTFDVYLGKVEYFSEEYGNSELASSVSVSRAKAKNLLMTQDAPETKETHTEVIIIALLVMAVAVGMAAFADRRNAEGKK